MRVKIFRDWDYLFQEIKVNEWLEENNNIAIHNILQSSAATSSSIYTTITIFYSELEFQKIL